MRHQANQRAFQFTHIRPDVRGDKQRHIRRQCYPFLLRLFLQDGDFRLQIWRLNIGNQAPLEPAAQAIFEFGQLFWWTVTGDHYLLHRLVQGIKRMEELFLGALFLRQELDVVNQQHVHRAYFIPEADHFVVAQRVDHLVGELLTGYVADRRLRHPPLDLVPDRLHQVSLAHPDAAVQKQRVIGLRRPFRHRLAGGVRELVPAADHERVKRITRIQLRGAVPVEPPLCRMQTRRRLRTRTRRRQPAIMPDRRVRWIVFGGNKFHILVSEPEIVDRLLNQIRVFIADVLELGGRNAHEKNLIAGVAVPRRLQPGVVGVPVDFLFQGVKDAHPGVRDDGGTSERHFLSEYRKRRSKTSGKEPILKFEFFFYCRAAYVLQYGLSAKFITRRTAY